MSHNSSQLSGFGHVEFEPAIDFVSIVVSAFVTWPGNEVTCGGFLGRSPCRKNENHRAVLLVALTDHIRHRSAEGRNTVYFPIGQNWSIACFSKVSPTHLGWFPLLFSAPTFILIRCALRNVSSPRETRCTSSCYHLSSAIRNGTRHWSTWLTSYIGHNNRYSRWSYQVFLECAANTDIARNTQTSYIIPGALRLWVRLCSVIVRVSIMEWSAILYKLSLRVLPPLLKANPGTRNGNGVANRRADNICMYVCMRKSLLEKPIVLGAAACGEVFRKYQQWSLSKYLRPTQVMPM